MVSPKKTISTLTGVPEAVVRSRGFDRWKTEFLNTYAHSPNGAAVVHFACGLDTRAHIVKLHRELVPDPLADTNTKAIEYSTYELQALSATESGWYGDIPADRPTVISIEGLSMYLAEEKIRNLVHWLVEHFGQAQHGHMIFDETNLFVMAAQGWLSPVTKSGSKLNWWLNKTLSVEAWAEGLTLREELLLSGRPLIKELSWKIRLQYAIAASLPWVL